LRPSRFWQTPVLQSSPPPSPSLLWTGNSCSSLSLLLPFMSLPRDGICVLPLDATPPSEHRWLIVHAECLKLSVDAPPCVLLAWKNPCMTESILLPGT